LKAPNSALKTATRRTVLRPTMALPVEMRYINSGLGLEEDLDGRELALEL
jgi:hypothetical protein